uniref:hypothetical protein n=1 Tax=Candidatus Roseilinea sp. TaxID=2838777 RepID=UPI00404A8D01
MLRHTGNGTGVGVAVGVGGGVDVDVGVGDGIAVGDDVWGMGTTVGDSAGSLGVTGAGVTCTTTKMGVDVAAGGGAARVAPDGGVKSARTPRLSIASPITVAAMAPMMQPGELKAALSDVRARLS